MPGRWYAVAVIQSMSSVWLRATAWTAAHHFLLSSTVSQSLLRFMSIGFIMLSNRLSLWSKSHIHTWLLKKSALIIWTFVGKVMSLLFSMLSRFVLAFLPRRKHLWVSWLKSLSAVILEPKRIKSVTVSIFSPIYLAWSDGIGCHDLSFLKAEF